jgi:multidrug transporter EmrE-like cation transporter
MEVLNSMNTFFPVLLILLSALLQAGSAALIKYSTKLKNTQPDGKLHILIFVIGLFLYGPSFILWASGLAKMNLAVAQPVFSGSMFLFTILISILIFKENLARYKFLGFAAIVGGIIVLVV